MRARPRVTVLLLLQVRCQMAKKENDMGQKRHLQSSMVSDLKQADQRITELRQAVDSCKNANGHLQQDLKALHELASEQRVGYSSLHALIRLMLLL